MSYSVQLDDEVERKNEETLYIVDCDRLFDDQPA